MRRFSFATAVVMLFWVTAASLSAQRIPALPLSIEVSAGAGIPTGEFADEKVRAETGFGFGVGALVHAMPNFGIYGGYSQTQFGCGDCPIFEIDEDVTDSGFDFGVQATSQPLAAGIALWLRAVALFHELTFSGNGGNLSSDRAIGWGIGGGVDYEPIPSVAVSPGVHFRMFEAEFPLGDLPDRSTDVSHITFDLGVSYRF